MQARCLGPGPGKWNKGLRYCGLLPRLEEPHLPLRHFPGISDSRPVRKGNIWMPETKPRPGVELMGAAAGGSSRRHMAHRGLKQDYNPFPTGILSCVNGEMRLSTFQILLLLFEELKPICLLLLIFDLCLALDFPCSPWLKR